jgi:hypothetical protein
MRLEEVLQRNPETKIVELLNSAHNSVWMSTSLNSEFFNGGNVRKAVEKTAKNISEFHLLLSSEVNWEERSKTLSWLVDLAKDNKITIKKSSEVIPHWLFVDGKNFRLEKGHLEESPLLTNNLIIWEATKPIAEMLQVKFEHWWNHGSSIA